jgi:hypothetical protein
MKLQKTSKIKIVILTKIKIKKEPYNMPRNHHECERGFIWTSKSYYVKNIKDFLGDAVDEIMVGFFHKDGSTTGEFGIRWYLLEEGKPASARLEAFHDAFDALALCTDLLEELRKWDNDPFSTERLKFPQPQDVVDILLKLGFKDLTKRNAP